MGVGKSWQREVLTPQGSVLTFKSSCTTFVGTEFVELEYADRSSAYSIYPAVARIQYTKYEAEGRGFIRACYASLSASVQSLYVVKEVRALGCGLDQHGVRDLRVMLMTQSGKCLIPPGGSRPLATVYRPHLIRNPAMRVCMSLNILLPLKRRQLAATMGVDATKPSTRVKGRQALDLP